VITELRLKEPVPERISQVLAFPQLWHPFAFFKIKGISIKRKPRPEAGGISKDNNKQQTLFYRCRNQWLLKAGTICFFSSDLLWYNNCNLCMFTVAAHGNH